MTDKDDGGRSGPHVYRTGEQTVFRLAGDFDITSADLIHAEVAAVVAADPNPPRLVLDMGRMGFFDSSGIRVLVAIWTLVRERHGELILVAVNPRCRALLDSVGLAPFFDVRDTLDQALGGQSPPAELGTP